ncbi:hypothetical protein [Saccharothrix obliqua]|nr:hypothetical protein [Saccharothrix obliqua]
MSAPEWTGTSSAGGGAVARSREASAWSLERVGLSARGGGADVWWPRASV